MRGDGWTDWKSEFSIMSLARGKELTS